MAGLMLSEPFLDGVLLTQCKDIDLEQNLSCHRVSVTEIGSNKIANHHFVIGKSVEDMGIKDIYATKDIST